MARTRSTAPDGAAPRRRGRPATPHGTLVQAAQSMIVQIEELVAEIAALRSDNDALRSELREAVAMLERASAALGGATPGRRGRRVAAAGPAPAAPGSRRRAPVAGARRVARGRATPDGVTPDVVKGVIGKLGEATARQIADELTKLAGKPVQGRAVRWLAEQPGVSHREVDGHRTYRLG